MFTFILAALVLIAPGYALLPKGVGAGPRLAFSLAASAAAYWMAAVILHLFSLPVSYSAAMLPLSVLWAIRQKVSLPGERVLAVFLAALFFSAILSPIPQYAYNADGVFQIEAGKSFLGGEWMNVDFVDNYFEKVTFPMPVSYRPPLNNFLVGFSYSLFGLGLSSAQAIVGVAAASLAAILYVICARLFDPRTALFAPLLLVAFNPYVVSMSYEVQAYPLAAYLSLCLFEAFGGKMHWSIIGGLIGLAYLTHPLSQVFAAVLIFNEALKRRFSLGGVKVGDIVLALGIVAVISSPWLLRNAAVYGDPLHTSGSYVMFLPDLEDYYSLSPPDKMGYIGYIMQPKNFFLIKGGALWKTFLPPPYSFAYSRLQLAAVIDPLELRSTLAGLLTYPLLLGLGIVAVRKREDDIVRLLILGLAASVVLFGYRASSAYSLIMPQALLAGGMVLYELKGHRMLVAFAVLQMAAASIVVYPAAAAERPDIAYEWMRQNLPADSKVMSRHHVMVTHLTGLRTVPTPKGGMNEIGEVAQRYGIDYYAVHTEDLRLRDVTLEGLNGSYALEKEIGGFWIYRL